jgi:hypothetical protein
VGDQIKNYKMGGACGAHGGGEVCIEGLCGNLRERDHLDDLD